MVSNPSEEVIVFCYPPPFPRSRYRCRPKDAL